MEKVLPVVISIAIIIVIAVVSQYSKTIAAVTATMPTSVPLGIWIVYSAEGGDRSKTAEFSEGLLIGIVPTVVFIVAAWFAARAGWGLLPIIGAGYGAWGLALAISLMLRHMLHL